MRYPSWWVSRPVSAIGAAGEQFLNPVSERHVSSPDILTRQSTNTTQLPVPLEHRYAALDKPYELRSHPLLERQHARESNARSYPRRLPIALKRAKGIYVEDMDGNVFIDCLAGAGTLALGHN